MTPNSFRNCIVCGSMYYKRTVEIMERERQYPIGLIYDEDMEATAAILYMSDGTAYRMPDCMPEEKEASDGNNP